MILKKGSLYKFKDSSDSPDCEADRLYSLISHFFDGETGSTMLILNDPASLEPLLADADEMEEAPASFEDKLLFTLTSIGESFRVLAKIAEEQSEASKEEETEEDERDRH